MRTTGLRTREIILDASCIALLPARAADVGPPAVAGACSAAPASAVVRLHRDTMRVDYFHTGGPKSGETFALDRVVNDGPWPGSRTQLVDATEPRPVPVRGPRRGERRAALLARLRVDLRRVGDDRARPKTVHRTFHESLRFPWPQAAGSRRAEEAADATTRFATSGRPTSIRRRGSSTARRSRRRRARSGPSSRTARPREKVDLLVIGEGYTAAEMPKFHTDVTRLRRRALRAGAVQEPPARLQRARRSTCPRRESGVNRPNAGVFRRTPLSAEYNIFDSERYVLTLDNRALRDAASAAPYEFIEILVNERTYGGGGIFNDQATAVGRQRVLPSTCSSTSSAITSRRWPTSTTRRTSPTRPAPGRSRSRGSRTSPRCSIRPR